MKKQQLRAAAEKAQIEINDQINQFILSSLEDFVTTYTAAGLQFVLFPCVSGKTAI